MLVSAVDMVDPGEIGVQGIDLELSFMGCLGVAFSKIYAGSQCN